MQVLVTGGAGFIGSHTVAALLAVGHRVRILDNFAPPVHRHGRPADLPASVEVIEGDVRRKADWETALEGVDAVYHFAAYQDYLPDFSTFFHVNGVGTALLYEVVVERRLALRKVIVASSQAVYGEGKYQCANARCEDARAACYPAIRDAAQLERGVWDHLCSRCGQAMSPQPSDESRVNPQNQYAVSKYMQEMLALSLGQRYGIPTVALRYSIVQGPKQSFSNVYSGACRIFCLSYFLGRAPLLYEDGQQLRDFVNIEDVVVANLLMLERPKADGQVFNIGGGTAYTVQAFAEMVRQAVGSSQPAQRPGAYRFGDTRHILSDISKARALGWLPRHPPRKSITDYLAWLNTQANVADVLDEAQRRMRELNVVRNASLALVSR